MLCKLFVSEVDPFGEVNISCQNSHVVWYDVAFKKYFDVKDNSIIANRMNMRF